MLPRRAYLCCLHRHNASSVAAIGDALAGLLERLPAFKQRPRLFERLGPVAV